ncbi:MAG: SH3 domain-containing protein [Emcibacteraceae bacterium]
MKPAFKIVFIVFLFNLCFSGAYAQQEERTTGASGYPLPRFMSLDDKITNMRTGPGLDYPIDWIYQKQDYPLKVIAEYGNWFKVMDIDGSTGWILRALLSLNRYGIIINGTQSLVKSPEESNIITLTAEQDVLGTVLQCNNAWCEMEIGGFKGWIRSENVWGVLEQETFD